MGTEKKKKLKNPKKSQEKLNFAALLLLEDSKFYPRSQLEKRKFKVVNPSEIASPPWNGSSQDVAGGTRRALRDWVLGQMFPGSFTIVLSFPGPKFRLESRARREVCGG